MQRVVACSGFARGAVPLLVTPSRTRAESFYCRNPFIHPVLITRSKPPSRGRPMQRVVACSGFAFHAVLLHVTPSRTRAESFSYRNPFIPCSRPPSRGRPMQRVVACSGSALDAVLLHVTPSRTRAESFSYRNPFIHRVLPGGGSGVVGDHAGTRYTETFTVLQRAAGRYTWAA